MIGVRVGPFEIEREASVPLPGDWYVANRAGTTRQRATKVFVKLLPRDAEQADRTALQAQHDALRQVEDGRIPKAVGYYEGSGAMVVEAVGGMPLTAIITGRESGEVQMTPATLCDVALDLAECLQHAHHKGRFHGHLRPDLLWLSPEGRLWVWGFDQQLSCPDAWAPPERARGLASSASTDQWSLGALLAALITGKAPWASLEDARRGSSDATVDTVTVQWPALGRLLRRMLDPEPSRRFPDLGPVRQELLALARKAGGLSERRELAITLAATATETFEPPPLETAPTPLSETPIVKPPITEDEPTVQQTPGSMERGVDLAEAESRDEAGSALADPGPLAEEAIAVVEVEFTEDIPEAEELEEASEAAPEASSEPELVAEPDADAIPDVPDPGQVDLPLASVPAPLERTPSEIVEGDTAADDEEEATQLMHNSAVRRAMDEARLAARGEASAADEEATVQFTATGDLEAHLLEKGSPTNPTAIPEGTDPGTDPGIEPTAPTVREDPRPDPHLLPEDGELPTLMEPRKMPQNQKIALGAIAVMVLVFILLVVMRA